MKIEFKIHKAKYKNSQWFNYIKPVWLNSISWEQGDPKIYKWLWWAICVE